MTKTRFCFATLAIAAGLGLASPATATAATPADVKVTVEARGTAYLLAQCPVTATNVGGTTAYDVKVSGFALSATQFTVAELAPGESETRIVDCGQWVPVFGIATSLDWNVFNNFAVAWQLLPS